MSVAAVTSVKDIRNLLIAAHENLRFERFLDLPAELRVMVYELYIDSFETYPDTLALPPLAITSRQMRYEAAPVFYERATFQLRYE